MFLDLGVSIVRGTIIVSNVVFGGYAGFYVGGLVVAPLLCLISFTPLETLVLHFAPPFRRTWRTDAGLFIGISFGLYMGYVMSQMMLGRV